MLETVEPSMRFIEQQCEDSSASSANTCIRYLDYLSHMCNPKVLSLSAALSSVALELQDEVMFEWIDTVAFVNHFVCLIGELAVFLIDVVHC